MEVIEAKRPEAHGSYLLRVNGSEGDNITKFFKPFDYAGSLSFWINSSVNGSVANATLLNNGVPVCNETINITTEDEWQRNVTSTPVKFNEVRFELTKGTTIYLDDIQYNNPGYWGEIEVTIRNLNIDPCTLREVAIGVGGESYFVRNYSVYTKRRGEWKKESFTRLYHYDIQAQGTVPIRINTLNDFGRPLEIPADKPLSVDVLLITDLGNNLVGTFAPPVPVADVKVETESIGVAYRDVLILAASDSYDPNGFITEYKWAVWAKNQTDYEPIYDYNLTGMKVRLELKQIGPFRIDLEVTDDTGMVTKLSQISGYISIPANRNFNPPTSLNAYNTTINTTTDSYKTCEIIAHVNDTWEKSVEDTIVYFEFLSKSGSITIQPGKRATNETGIATTNVIMTGNGTVEIEVSVREFVARRLVDYVYIEW